MQLVFFWRVWPSFSCATPCLGNKMIFKPCSHVHWGMLRSSVFAFNLSVHLLCHVHMGQCSMFMHLSQCLCFLKGTLKPSSTHSQPWTLKVSSSITRHKKIHLFVCFLFNLSIFFLHSFWMDVDIIYFWMNENEWNYWCCMWGVGIWSNSNNNTKRIFSCF